MVVVGAHWGATALPGKPVAPQCAPTSRARVWDNPVFAPDEPAMTQKTILNDAHRALGAKMVDFGGWDMPLNYGSKIEEHHQGRRAPGMFDVPPMNVVDLPGATGRDFLRRRVATSVEQLTQP